MYSQFIIKGGENMLGVAGNIRTEHIITDGFIADKINKWMQQHPNVIVIDIKFSTSANSEEYATEVLIIYREG